MKKITLYIVFVFSLMNQTGYSQYTLVKPNNYLELSGYLLSYYNYRFYTSDHTDRHQNTFALDYAVIELKGNVHKVWNYDLQLNTAAFINPNSSDGAIMEANASYNMLNDALEIKGGYGKVHFNRTSMVSNTETPYLERPDVDRGSVYNRRDMGVTARYSLWNKKINIYAGAYTGTGTNSIVAGYNDPGGKLEYTGRIEVSYPARYRNQEVDLVHLQVPVFGFGIDGRYADKQSPMGGDSTLTIDGIKTAASANVDFLYKGFAAHFEVVRLKMQPRNADTLLLEGKPTNYLLGGGVVASVNYFIAPIHTVIAVRYDQYNPNDIKLGDTQQTISYCLNYMFAGQRAMFKLQYWQRIKDPNAAVVWTPDQFRAGFQLMF